jgi:hypothetical protein
MANVLTDQTNDVLSSTLDFHCDHYTATVLPGPQRHRAAAHDPSELPSKDQGQQVKFKRKAWISGNFEGWILP